MLVLLLLALGPRHTAATPSSSSSSPSSSDSSSSCSQSFAPIPQCSEHHCEWNQTDFSSFCTAHCDAALCAAGSSHMACSDNNFLPFDFEIPASNVTNLEIDANNFPWLGPALLVNNPQLLELWAYGNNIREISPALIQSIPLVQRLDFGNNQLETLENGTFANTTKLSNLWLYGNPWQCDCRLQWLQEWINLPSNLGVLYESDNTLCAGPPNMVGFTIGNASLPICCPDVPCADGQYNAAICNTTTRNTRACLTCPPPLVGQGGICNVTCLAGTQPNSASTACEPCPAPFVGTEGACHVQCSYGRNALLTACLAAPSSSSSLPKWVVPVTVVIIVLCIIAACVTYWLYYKRRQRFQHDIALHEKLLEDSQTEIADLTRAWQIGHDDLKFVRRIDADSPGAFGEVWLAQWGEREVAVKKLQQLAIELSSTAKAAFDKEVRMVRSLRHANIVLFWGAGSDPEGK